MQNLNYDKYKFAMYLIKVRKIKGGNHYGINYQNFSTSLGRFVIVKKITDKIS